MSVAVNPPKISPDTEMMFLQCLYMFLLSICERSSEDFSYFHCFSMVYLCKNNLAGTGTDEEIYTTRIAFFDCTPAFYSSRQMGLWILAFCSALLSVSILRFATGTTLILGNLCLVFPVNLKMSLVMRNIFELALFLGCLLVTPEGLSPFYKWICLQAGSV